MANESNDFVNGLFVKKQLFKSGGSLIKVSVKVSEFKKWLDEKKEADNEYVNIILASTKSDENKMYAKLDTWKPDSNYQKPAESSAGSSDFDTTGDGADDLPF